MDIELKKKLESLKSDGKKKKGCSSCKKKKEPIVLSDVIEEDNMYIPTPDEIRLAYIELGNRVLDKKEFINKVYNFLFNEDFNFNCPSCVNGQARRLKNYIIEVLKLEV
jgi:ribosomal protein L37AE/L43A